MSANKIKKPILLIHGEEDSNSGTLTMQVPRDLYIAIYIVFMYLHTGNNCSFIFSLASIFEIIVTIIVLAILYKG